ncbi:hypothetical protein AMTR_s00121p00130060 [Amborella trichopoda]|uniref:Uncharacterized protein n=1 Tax=Amborella trichopoda TaxID=13333 RepID=W1NQK5_AMBTC|nr:hypothetical protein AMTR_s00121p00130060 [Amborella trichopoda]
MARATYKSKLPDISQRLRKKKNWFAKQNRRYNCRPIFRSEVLIGFLNLLALPSEQGKRPNEVQFFLVVSYFEDMYEVENDYEAPNEFHDEYEEGLVSDAGAS